MDKPLPQQNTIRPIHLVIIVWLISVIWTVFYWYLYYKHYNIEIHSMRLVALGVLDWLFWLVALPVVVKLAKKYPPVRLRSILLLHLPLNVIATVLTVVVSVLMRFWLETGSPPDFLENVRNRLVSEGSWYFLFYWFVVGAYFTVDFHAAFSRSKKESLEFQLENENLSRRLIESRLSMLRAQLQPHFLFNSLHSVSSLMDVSVPQARAVLIQLANLLRDALEISQKDVHPLIDEYRWLEKYLELECVRFKDQLKWRSDLPEETHAATVPCLLLQPLLENIFKHARKKQDHVLEIGIRVQRKQQQLMIEVADNGVGFPPQKSAFKEGNGIRYVREILHTHYAGKATIEYMNNQNGGATVRLSMPYLEWDADE